jgi:hypothetical protein
MTKDEQNLLRDFTELCMELVKLRGDVKLKDMEADNLRRDNDEILQAHTALVERLHDVTTMLEAERARIEGAPVGIVDAEMVVPDGFRLYPEDLWDKRVALVVLDKVTP